MSTSKLILIVGGCFLSLLSTAFAGSTSLTVQYPPQNGTYNKITVSALTLTPPPTNGTIATAQQSIENINSCSNENPTSSTPYCQPGLMYFDGAQLWVSTPTTLGQAPATWQSAVPATSSNNTNLDIGGFTIPEIDVTQMYSDTNGDGYLANTSQSDALFNNYTVLDDITDYPTSSASGLFPLNPGSGNGFLSSWINNPTGATSVNSLYGGPTGSLTRVQPGVGQACTGTSLSNMTCTPSAGAFIQINTQYIPKGNYIFNYSATVNVDQYINVYKIKYTWASGGSCSTVTANPLSSTTTSCTWAPSVYLANDIPYITVARALISQSAETPLPVTFYLQQCSIGLFGTASCSNVDTSSPMYDTGDMTMASYEAEQTAGYDYTIPVSQENGYSGTSWIAPVATTNLNLWSDDLNSADAAYAPTWSTYPSTTFSRSYTESMNGGGNSPNWKYYRVVFKKNAVGNKTYTYTDGVGNKYTFYYNIPEMVQVLNLTLDVQLQASSS